MKEVMKKIFREDGRTIIMAFDFGPMGITKVDEPGKMIREACEAGVDAVLATYGLIKNFREDFLDKAVLLRVDAFPTLLAGPQDEIPDTYFDAQTAYDLGVDGIISNGYVGRKIDGRYIDVPSQKVVTRLAQQCDKLGLAYSVEMLPYNTEPFTKDPSLRDEKAMKVACRIAAEMGADIIKTQYTGPDFKNVVKNTYLPIVALGGPYTENPRDSLEYVRAALDAGCKGVAMGRNIYGRPNVGAFVRALNKLIHEDSTVDEAMAELEK